MPTKAKSAHTLYFSKKKTHQIHSLRKQQHRTHHIFFPYKKKGADRRFHSCHKRIRHRSHASYKANGSTTRYMRCMEASQPYPYAPIAGGLIQPHALGTGPFPSRDSDGAAGGIHAPVATPSRSDQDNEGALDRGTTTTKIISRGGW